MTAKTSALNSNALPGAEVSINPPVLRSMLFVPGDQPRMIEKAAWLQADAIILDLEDGVAAKDKLKAREIVRATMTAGPSPRAPVWLRPNALATGLFEDDVLACVLPGLMGVVLPKSRTVEELILVSSVLDVLERARGFSAPLLLALLIETPQAVQTLRALVSSSARIVALLFGADDLAAELGLTRTARNEEVQSARAQVALAAHARGCEAVDLVYGGVRNVEGLTSECREGKAMGYTGKQVIHPAQLEPVHEIFSPSQEEIAWARRIVEASRAAPRGAFVLDGRMVDAPIVRQAQRVLHRVERVAQH